MGHMTELSGKIAVVTGGGAGIGQAAVACMRREGARVLVVDWNATEDASFRRADISDSRQAAASIQAAVERFGGLDILVNNAGIQSYGDAVTTTEEIWDRTMNVNLKGQWLMARAAIPEMLKRGGGAIVNVASVQGLASQKNVLAYATSKHAMIGLTRSMAVDFSGRGIRVNCVCPGTVDTPMVRSTIDLDQDPEKLRGILNRMHPIGRIAEPREIGEVIAFLASDRASFMTGSIVTVDGGLLSPIAGSPD
ncbi:MAG: glucose 1-dehydrogenase [Acidobacteriota bacterium]|nr:glucose 1-dehydrogenase [Acidobacteriota bacterium]